MSDLDISLSETIQSLDEFITTDFGTSLNEERQIDNQEEYLDIFENAAMPAIKKPKETIHYEFGKLFEQHPIFGVEYFLKRFNQDQEVLEELLNMKSNLYNQAQYYCSFEYLRTLFQKRKLLDR